MNIIDAIRKRILKFLGLEKLSQNPDGERFTFICDEENIIRQNLEEYRVWYNGDSNGLLNYYTNEQLYGNAREPIYNRNRRNYFWGLSSEEADIKRVHSGIPNAIVTTLVNAIGKPNITSANAITKTRIEKIIDDNDFFHLLNQQQMPLTMVEGWGAFKPTFNAEFGNRIVIQYYEAQDVEYAYKNGLLIGIIFKDYYKYKNKNYVLLETRRIDKNASYVEYELFRQESNNEVVPCELSTIPELEDLKGIMIPNYKKILGVPCKFFFDANNKNYGKSVFAGKIDLFDDLDQILSQDSQTVRVSTPVEYYPVDLLERQRNGQPKMPKVYNRQYVAKESMPDGDGNSNGKIETTQPNLNFEQYSANAKAKLDMILTGLLSPATMGIDIAKKDNADAQREKEKVTIMTRNNIIDREERIIKQILSVCLDLATYLEMNVMPQDSNYDISVKFNEFANPSFENEITILGSAWVQGEISTERYVDLLWGDKLSEEDKAKEIAWLDNNKQQDNLQFGDIEDENEIRTDLSTEEERPEKTEQIEHEFTD